MKLTWLCAQVCLLLCVEDYLHMCLDRGTLFRHFMLLCCLTFERSFFLLKMKGSDTQFETGLRFDYISMHTLSQLLTIVFIMSFILYFSSMMSTSVRSVVTLMTGLQSLLKQVFHRLQPSASSFSFQYFLEIIQQLFMSSCFSPVTSSFCVSYNKVFQKAVHMQDVTNPASLPPFIVCRILLFSLSLCNTPSSHTRSVHLITHPSPAPLFKI